MASEACATTKTPQEEACEEHIRGLMAQMTVEEKCMQIGQIVSGQRAQGKRRGDGYGGMVKKGCKTKGFDLIWHHRGPLIG
jgi:hypothetical protein